MRLAIAGLAHGHVQTIFDEVGRWDDLQLVAMSDPDPGLLERYNAAYGVPAYADHREMLAQHQPDVVGVAAVYNERATVVVDALHAGAHVLVDKPLCTTLDELDAIEAALAGAPGVVSVLFEKRFYGTTLAVRRMVADGELGEIVQIAATGPHKLNRPTRPEWFFRREAYGGVIGDLAVHDVDLTLLFSGATSGWVSGMTGDPVPDRTGFSDHGTAFLRAAGVAATIEVNWLTPAASPYHGDYRMRLTGTKGTAEIFFARGVVEVVTDTSPPRTLELPGNGRVAGEAIGSLLRGESPEVDTAASLAATRVALLAQHSADNDGEVASWKLG
ncbi:MAG TPA: Gfo/Idh/MocA family oxidoreductase [Kribbella sp.]